MFETASPWTWNFSSCQLCLPEITHLGFPKPQCRSEGSWTHLVLWWQKIFLDFLDSDSVTPNLSRPSLDISLPCLLFTQALFCFTDWFFHWFQLLLPAELAVVACVEPLFLGLGSFISIRFCSRPCLSLPVALLCSRDGFSWLHSGHCVGNAEQDVYEF